MLLETTSKYRADSETQAENMIKNFREEAAEKGYIVKKAGFEHKTKKSKGEIIAEVWVVTITQIFADVWEDLV